MASVMEMNLNYTLGTQKIEKVNPSKEAIHLCKEMSKKNISANEAVAAIKLKYRIPKGV